MSCLNESERNARNNNDIYKNNCQSYKQILFSLYFTFQVENDLISSVCEIHCVTDVKQFCSK